MFLIDKMLVGGIRFVFDKLAVAADQELNDDTSLRESLLAAQLRVELGEMSQEEFAALEDEVLARIREIRERRGQGNGPIEFGGARAEGEGSGSLGASDIAGIEASFVADDFHEPLPEPAAPPPSQAVIDVEPSPEPPRKRTPKPARRTKAAGRSAARSPRKPSGAARKKSRRGGQR